MLRFALVLALAGLSGPAFAEAGKEESCRKTGEVWAAVQKARKDRVGKDQATNEILAANPTWPADLSQALPAVVEYVYSLKNRDLRKTDLGAQAEQQCLQQWEQIQATKKNLQTN